MRALLPLCAAGIVLASCGGGSGSGTHRMPAPIGKAAPSPSLSEGCRQQANGTTSCTVERNGAPWFTIHGYVLSEDGGRQQVFGIAVHDDRGLGGLKRPDDSADPPVPDASGWFVDTQKSTAIFDTNAPPPGEECKYGGADFRTGSRVRLTENPMVTVCNDDVNEGNETIVITVQYWDAAVGEYKDAPQIVSIISNHGTAQKAALSEIADRTASHVLGTARVRATADKSGAWVNVTQDAQSVGADWRGAKSSLGVGVTRAAFKGSAGLPYYANLWVVHPYAAWRPDAHWTLWGVGGLGTGQMKTRWQNATYKPRLRFWMLGYGVDHARAIGPVTLNTGMEGFYAEARSNTKGTFQGATGYARSLRGYSGMSVAIGALTPSVEAGWGIGGFDGSAGIEYNAGRVKPSISVEYSAGDVSVSGGLTVGF